MGRRVVMSAADRAASAVAANVDLASVPMARHGRHAMVEMVEEDRRRMGLEGLLRVARRGSRKRIDAKPQPRVIGSQEEGRGVIRVFLVLKRLGHSPQPCVARLRIAVAISHLSIKPQR